MDLKENKIFYKLDKIRSEAIMVAVVVPGRGCPSAKDLLIFTRKY